MNGLSATVHDLLFGLSEHQAGERIYFNMRLHGNMRETRRFLKVVDLFLMQAPHALVTIGRPARAWRLGRRTTLVTLSAQVSQLQVFCHMLEREYGY